ncbi:MAG: PD-(D/E)XK nuclease family protein [Bacteroidales bacterium]|jgi:CRISPR/Cas system-associated exonuclease Cas4 (RecB family)
MEIFHLKEFDTVSPTLAETLRLCMLRAGLSNADNATPYIMGNPKAWLGTAYHAVLEGSRSLGAENFEVQVQSLWVQAIQKEYDRSRLHQWDKRFGPPESWPGYYVTASLAVIRAMELTKKETSRETVRAQNSTNKIEFIERNFAGSNGRIVGRPDVVSRDEVVDFKSGEIFEERGEKEIKKSYIRQLRIYAFLVRETLGWWPMRGVLLPMGGARIEVDLKPNECLKEAEDAIRLLEEYNNSIVKGRDPVVLASPSSTNCRWCPFQLYCPAFWNSIDPNWANDLSSGSIRGRANEKASPIHNALAFSLSIHVDRGTITANQHISLFPLDPLVHPDVAQVQAGDLLHVTGLFARADDSLIATKRTMIVLDEHIPRIEI